MCLSSLGHLARLLGDGSRSDGGSDDNDEQAELPIVADAGNYLAGAGHEEENEDTNVTAVEQAVARTSKRQRKAPSKFDN